MDLLEEYIKSGRIKLNTHKYHEAFTVHDPCNYVRKSVMLYNDNPTNGEKTRWIAQQCIDPSHYREMIDDPLNNLCCGAGGGAWAMPYDAERLAYGKMKADQIKATGAEIVDSPTTPPADDILFERGVFVIPDILANSGGVTVSYFEWVQDRQGYFWPEGMVNERLKHIMVNAFNDVVGYGERHNVNNRIAAYMLAIDRVAFSIKLRGIYA